MKGHAPMCVCVCVCVCGLAPTPLPPLFSLAPPQDTCANYKASTPNQAYYCDLADGNPTCTFSGLARGACVNNTFTTCGISTAFTSASGKQEPSCLSYLYTNADDGG
jgi:hypothetical protein